MNQQQQLPIPALTAPQVEWIINYINNEVITKHGVVILEYVKNIAIQNAQNQEVK